MPAEDEARDLGAAADLRSDRRFIQAHAFYEAVGYRATGRTLQDLSRTVEYHFVKSL